MRQRPVPNAWWIEQFGCPAQVSPWISRVISPWVSYGFFPEIHPLTAPKKCRAKARYRRTGNPAPDSWRYIASKGASGFKTQVLINTKARCRTGPSRNSRLNWSLTYIFIISSSSCSRVVAAVLLRANPPVRPHNFLGILKEYKVRPPLNFTFNWEDQQGH